jgi:DNA-binding transcriptional LysR family regulator
MRTDLITLRLFLTVFKLGNLSRAAERENIAPSAISKRLQELEQECGTLLFYRHARGVTPTPAALALAQHAKEVLSGMTRMAADMSTFASGEKGEVRVHAHSSAVIEFLPQEIASFREFHPGVQIILKEEPSPEVIFSIDDAIADIGILAGNVPVPNAFTKIPYHRDQLMAVLPSGHRLAARTSISFSEVADEGVISPENGSSLHLLLSEISKMREQNLELTIEVRSLEAAIRMAEAGLGTAIVPAGIVTGHSRDGVVGVPLSDKWATRELILCIKDHALLSASAHLMLDHLREKTCESKKPPLPKRK